MTDQAARSIHTRASITTDLRHGARRGLLIGTAVIAARAGRSEGSVLMVTRSVRAFPRGLVAAMLAVGAMTTVPGAAAAPSRHLCGWIVNPTPANWSLFDRTGEWEMAVQGGRQAPGMDTIPDLTEHDWQVTNGSSYGQGCACLDAVVDARRRRILSFGGFRQLPLRRCRSDHALKGA